MEVPRGRTICSLFLSDNSWSSDIEKLWKKYLENPKKAPNKRKDGGKNLDIEFCNTLYNCFDKLKNNRGILLFFSRDDGHTDVFYHKPDGVIQELHTWNSVYQHADYFTHKKAELNISSQLYIVEIVDTLS